MFGLSDNDIKSIITAVSEYPEVKEVIIFGSRAKGNFKHGSDVDLALKGDQITHTTIMDISWKLNEESPMPYHFDVLNYQAIKNPDLVEHINRVGKVLKKLSEHL